MNEVTYKKRRLSSKVLEFKTKESYSHHGKYMVDFVIPIKLTDSEEVFIEWYNVIKGILPLTIFKDLLNLKFVNEECMEYCSSLMPFDSSCSKHQNVNRQLNELLIQSIDEPLINELNLNFDGLSYCNFEKIKIHFQAKINIFYLMELENKLTFDTNNKVKFLHDIEYLSNVYNLIFNEPPSKDLKINWVITSLNKNNQGGFNNNNELLMAVQKNWDSVYNDPLSLRKLLLKY